MCFDANSRPPIGARHGEAADLGEVELVTADGNCFTAFRARARRPTGAGALVLPDIRGLHPYYEELAVRFAEHGVDALAIDWFGRTAGPGRRGEEFDDAPHVRQLTWPGIVADITSAAAYLRSEAGGSVRALFPVGFCLGGRIAFIAPSLDLGVAGAVGFYGRPTDQVAHGSPPPYTVANRLTAPILGIFAGDDEYIPNAAVAAYEEALRAAGAEHRLLTYPGTPHSFFDQLAGTYAAEAASAWRETMDFITSGTARSA